ncbi:MAG: aromatic amino acid lyase, partial [Planctomycetes bacterium]|nr:aromatic amino acid lyase [Planctomycetota bacterium]
MVTISLGEYLEERTILSAALGEPVKLVLGRAAQKRVQAARAEVESILEIGRPVYGVNTGFGLLAKERIAPEDTATLQRNLLLSHAVGTGPDLKPEEKRVAMILRLHSLCR